MPHGLKILWLVPYKHGIVAPGSDLSVLHHGRDILPEASKLIVVELATFFQPKLRTFSFSSSGVSTHISMQI